MIKQKTLLILTLVFGIPIALGSILASFAQVLNMPQEIGLIVMATGLLPMAVIAILSVINLVRYQTPQQGEKN
jgi:hypothetical protein